jgi:hypothetical protein
MAKMNHLPEDILGSGRGREPVRAEVKAWQKGLIIHLAEGGLVIGGVSH